MGITMKSLLQGGQLCIRQLLRNRDSGRGYYVQSKRLVNALEHLNYSAEAIDQIKEKLGIK